MSRTSILKFCAIILVFYLALLVAMAIAQRSLIYHPGNNDSPPNYEGITELTLTAADGTRIVAWYHPPATVKEDIIVYFHGNAGTLHGRMQRFGEIINNEKGFIAVSYRGYGASEGSPSEKGIYQDAEATINYLLQQGIDEGRMIFFGESLGTAVAVEMGTRYKPALVFLQAPLTCMAESASYHYPYVVGASLFIVDRYDSLGKIDRIKAPLFIVQSEQDAVLPISMGKKLFAQAKEPKKAIFTPHNTHNDFSMAWLLREMDDYREHMKEGNVH